MLRVERLLRLAADAKAASFQLDLLLLARVLVCDALRATPFVCLSVQIDDVIKPSEYE
jgi:hypothetical protein